MKYASKIIAADAAIIPVLGSIATFNYDAELLDAAYQPQFGYAHPYPGCAKFFQDQLRDMFGQSFNKREMTIGYAVANALDDLAVVDSVFDPVGFARLAVRQADFQVELYGLRSFVLPFVNADVEFEFEIA